MTNTLSEVCSRARLYILKLRGEDGLWQVLALGHGKSDEWATAFVLRMLDAYARMIGDDEWLQNAVGKLIERQHPDGGWGYNEHCESDSDSTANVLWLLQALQSDPQVLDKAMKFLLLHQLSDGGFATYQDENFRTMYQHRPEVLAAGSRGWCGTSHCCVSAMVALVLREGPERRRLFQYLLDSQSTDGGWPSYWWAASNYSTVTAIKALGSEVPNRERVIEKLLSTSLDSAFDVGLAAEGLILLGEQRAAEPFVNWLASQQQPDGGWPPSPILVVPRPSQINPELATEVLWDEEGGVFSTAQAIRAIGMYISQGPE